MNLKEFDLDLPYIKNEFHVGELIKSGKSLEESTKIDYAKNWKEKRITFRLETRCISSMFERLFEDFYTDNCWKILVEVVSEISDNKIHNYSGVYAIQASLNYYDYESSDEMQKKRIALYLLMEGIQSICNLKKWDFSPFLRARDLIIQAKYINEWVWRTPVKSPDGKLSAEILCKHGINAMDIYLIINESNRKIGEKLIVSTKPDEFSFANLLGKLEWPTLRTINLISKNNEKIFRIDLNDELTIHSPK